MSCDWCQNSFDMDETCQDEFKMWQGLVGPYYIPYVDEYGNISWTNTGNLPNPNPINIKGPTGRGLEIEGIVETIAELPEFGTGVWMVGEAEPYDGYIFVNGQWKYFGQLSLGPQGQQGPQGPQGPQGESGKGVPAGGTVGQFLRKASGLDFDSEWYTITAEDILLDDNVSAQEHIYDLHADLDSLCLEATAVTVNANGTTTHALDGLTDEHVVGNWGMFMDSACTTPIPENAPTCDITITTNEDEWVLVITNYSSTFYLRPTFILKQN